MSTVKTRTPVVGYQKFVVDALKNPSQFRRSDLDVLENILDDLKNVPSPKKEELFVEAILRSRPANFAKAA